jgi:hypothetical protein
LFFLELGTTLIVITEQVKNLKHADPQYTIGNYNFSAHNLFSDPYKCLQPSESDESGQGSILRNTVSAVQFTDKYFYYRNK